MSACGDTGRIWRICTTRKGDMLRTWGKGRAVWTSMGRKKWCMELIITDGSDEDYIYNIILRLYIWLYPIIVYRSYQIIEIQSDFCLNENCMDLMNPWSFPGVWVDQMILKYSFWTTWDIIKEVTYERWGSSYERMRVAGPHGILIKIACIELLSLGSTVITNSASPITIIHGDSINQLWGDCWDISIIFLKYISYNLNIDRIYKQ
jgi:hypothetical protein